MTETICLQYALWLRAGQRPSTRVKQSEKVPSVGDKRWLNIKQWHSTQPSAKVWVLFPPPLSHDEGWEMHPHEMEQSAVIECEVLDFADFLPVTSGREPPRDSQESLYCRVRTFRVGWFFTPENWRHSPHLFELRGWMQVRVLRVVLLSQIPLHFPEGEKVNTAQMWPHRWQCESENLLFEAGSGDEAFEWSIRTKRHPARVVLHSFEISGEAATICNWPLRE